MRSAARCAPMACARTGRPLGTGWTGYSHDSRKHARAAQRTAAGGAQVNLLIFVGVIAQRLQMIMYLSSQHWNVNSYIDVQAYKHRSSGGAGCMH
jgi:hypothetical protein